MRLVVLSVLLLPLIAHGATIEVTAGGSPSAPTLQMTDASGNVLAQVVSDSSAALAFQTAAASGETPQTRMSISAIGDVIIAGNLTASAVVDGSSSTSVSTLLRRIEALEAQTMPAGAVSAFAMSTCPTGWLSADGSAVSRAEYPMLFAAISTTWGAGDGSSTFALPDLRAAHLRGTGTHGTATQASGVAFTGPSVGALLTDMFQGHSHSSTAQYCGVFPSGGCDSSNGGAAFTNVNVGAPISDGVNGNPRYGAETRPFAAGVRYCIKT